MFELFDFIVFGHRGFVRGISVAPNGRSFVSCGDDKTVKQWRMSLADAGNEASDDDDTDSEDEDGESKPRAVSNDPRLARRRAVFGEIEEGQRGQGGDGAEPSETFLGKFPFLGVDCHWTRDMFATCSTTVDVWDSKRWEGLPAACCSCPVLSSALMSALSSVSFLGSVSN